MSGPTLPEVVNAHLARSWPPLSIPPARGGPAPTLVDLVERMTARRREDRPSSWEEIVATLWKALEEVRPVEQELAEKRAAVAPAEAAAGPAEEKRVAPALEPAARLLSREMLLGRAVLLFGIASFVGAVAFAVHVVVSAPAPPPAPVPPAAASPPPTAVPAAPGRLLVALVPDGVLEELVDASGRPVAVPPELPADLSLPAGRYRARLAHAESGCAMTVSFDVRPGGTTRVLESCAEPR